MSVRLNTIPDEYYHVYNRGVDKRIIFNEERDFERFLLLLILANDTAPCAIDRTLREGSVVDIIKIPRTPIVTIHAFCLLSNHYHLLLSPQIEGGVAKFFQKVATGYTMYFNKKYDRSGSLFQGKYKIKHITEDRYLRYLFEYIHLNPIRNQFDKTDYDFLVTKELLNRAEIYPWSSMALYSRKNVQSLAEMVYQNTLFGDLFSSYQKHFTNLLNWKESDLGDSRFI